MGAPSPLLAARSFALLVLTWCLAGAVRTKHLSNPTPPEILPADVWPLFQRGAGLCGDVEIAGLKQPKEDLHVGSAAGNRSNEIPPCPLSGEAMNQAGGHVGDFYALEGARIAKRTRAFDDSGGSAVPDKAKRKIQAGLVEWTAYSEMWCLRRLEDIKAELTESTLNKMEHHPLRNFALDEADEAWAPKFYGICQVRGDGAASGAQDIGHPNQQPDSNFGLFMVFDDVLAKLNKPRQLDLKLGFSTVEPTETAQKRVQLGLWDVVSPSAQDGARLAGMKIWFPFQQQWGTFAGWYWSTTRLTTVFNMFFDCPGPMVVDAMAAIDLRLRDMATWWSVHGTTEFRAVALSVLMAYECEPGDGVPQQPPVVKLIDYAHFFPAKETPSWPEDGVAEGLMSAVVDVEVLRAL